MLKLLIVILNYRTPELAIQAATSTLEDLSENSIELAIVDNCSGDGSAEQFHSWAKTTPKKSAIHIISAPDNLGFSGGNNLALKAIPAEQYLLMNSDAALKGDALQQMMAASNMNDKVGLIAPRIEHMNGQAQNSLFATLSPTQQFLSACSTRLIERLLGASAFGASVAKPGEHDGWACFACVLLSREAIEQVGYLDDGFFMYFEDADYCRRLRKAGLKVITCPNAHVIHLRGQSSSVEQNAKQYARQPRYYYIARTRYFYRYGGYWSLFSANIMWTVGWIIHLIKRLFGSKKRIGVKHQARDIWTGFLNPADIHHPRIMSVATLKRTTQTSDTEGTDPASAPELIHTPTAAPDLKRHPAPEA